PAPRSSSCRACSSRTCSTGATRAISGSRSTCSRAGRLASWCGPRWPGSARRFSASSGAPGRAPPPLKPDGVHRRQARVERLPGVAPVGAEPQAARRRAEGEVLPRRVDVEAVAVDEVVGVLLRQALAQGLPRLAAVARAVDDHGPVLRDALLV